MPSILQDYSTRFQCDLTILIPLGDRLDYFEACLKSICQQKQQGRTEILLLDDASDNFSRADLEAIFQKYSIYLPPEKYTVHYVRHPQNLGESGNVNWGLKLANSPWIYIVHDDDLLLENTLSWFEDILQKNPDLDLVSGAFYSINEADDIVAKSDFLAHTGLVDAEFQNLFLADNPLQGITTIYNKRIFEKAGFFNPELEAAADWELFRRICKVPNLKWYYLPQHIGAYRLHDQQKSAQYETQISDRYIWQVLALSENYFSSLEQKVSRKSRYWQCFQAVDDYFMGGQFDTALAVCLDLVEFSGLGDRLWLEVLNQSDFKNKQQIYELMLNLVDKMKDITTST